MRATKVVGYGREPDPWPPFAPPTAGWLGAASGQLGATGKARVQKRRYWPLGSTVGRSVGGLAGSITHRGDPQMADSATQTD